MEQSSNPTVPEEDKFTEESLGVPSKAELKERLSSENLWQCTSEDSKGEKEEEFQAWLYTHFQMTLENALRLINREDVDESKPFEFKYEGRAMIKQLLDELQNQNDGKDSSAKELAKAICLKYLGVTYMDCEELADSQELLSQALKIFDNLALELKLRYLNDVVDCYNTIGIVHCNRGA